MNNGSFFRLDIETSKVVNGITFFNYVDLPDLYAKDGEIRYPIRLSISSESVSMFVHYYKAEYYKEKAVENGIIVPPPFEGDVRKNIEETKAVPRHSEEVIINLPFTSKDSEALSSSIKHIYNSAFPFGNYLNDLLKTRYGNELTKDSDYYNTRTSQINKDSYSSLTIWGLLNKDKDRINLLDNKDQITKFLRKLLLDFMFDLMHSDVFECSKYYLQMREGLMNDFFFSSIVKKSEYYYNRRLIRNRLNSILKSINNSQAIFDVVGEIRKNNKIRNRKLWWSRLLRPNDIDVVNRINIEYETNVESIGRNECFNRQAYDAVQSIKNLYAEKLDDSEAIWMDVIMSPLADKHFSFSPEWYEDQVSSERKEGTFSVSESWFVNPEEEMARVNFPLPEHDSGNSIIHYLNSFELSNLIGSKDNSSISARNTRISKWYYRRFDFKDTFRLHLFNNVNILFTIILWLFAITSVMSSFFTDLWEYPIYFSTFPLLCSLSLFASSLCIKLSSYKYCNSKRIDDVLLRMRYKRESKKAFNGALSFLCLAVFLIFSIFNFFYGFVDTTFYNLSAWGVLLLVVCLLLGFNHKNRVVDNIHLLLPRLVASIMTAWIMIVIGNDIVKEYLSIPVLFIITIIVFVFVLYENNKALPHQKPQIIVFRAVELMLISFSIAVIVGIFAVDVLSTSLLKDASDYNLVVDNYSWPLLANYKEFTITIFPKYLIPFSFLAMFIGVFIQMIFEEKNITEM